MQNICLRPNASLLYDLSQVCHLNRIENWVLWYWRCAESCTDLKLGRCQNHCPIHLGERPHTRNSNSEIRNRKQAKGRTSRKDMIRQELVTGTVNTRSMAKFSVTSNMHCSIPSWPPARPPAARRADTTRWCWTAPWPRGACHSPIGSPVVRCSDECPPREVGNGWQRA